MADRYSYMVVTTDFDLEPLLEQYQRTYPEGQFESYDVVFRAVNEENRSYIVVFALAAPGRKAVNFAEFLDAHCKLNKRRAVASQVNNVFPDLKRANVKGYRVFGDLGNYKELAN